MACGQAARRRKRAARLSAGWRRTDGREQGAIQGSSRTRIASVDPLCRERARRHQRVRAVRRRCNRAGGRAAGCPADAVGSRSRRRQEGLQNFAAVSELFGDRRLRARPRFAPAAVPCVFDQGVRVRQARLEQRSAAGRAAEAAAATRAAAQLQKLRRSFAGGKDGGEPGRSTRFPA